MRISSSILTPLLSPLLLSPLLLSPLRPSRADAQATQPDGAGIRSGTLPAAWNTGGPKCMEMPEWQVHEYNPDLYILRQSGCTDYEKPFVFLLFGADRALLLDTGSRRGNIAAQLRLTAGCCAIIAPPFRWSWSTHTLTPIMSPGTRSSRRWMIPASR
jgi:hypothetical protein